jgi:hypothetical protein
VSNGDQKDGDGDGKGNACDSDDDNDGVVDTSDNCNLIANANQADIDGDLVGDVCDTCPKDALNDADKDGFCGDIDNCPSVPKMSTP